MSHLERILKLTPDERRDALCFLAGFNPFVLEKALDEMDRQRSRQAAYTHHLEVAKYLTMASDLRNR